MPKPAHPLLPLAAILLSAVLFPAAAQTYAAGRVTAAPLPPPAAAQPDRVASTAPAPSARSETEPDAPRSQRPERLRRP